MYELEDDTKVRLRDQSFIFQNAELTDSEYFSRSILNGRVSHVNLSSWSLGLNIDSERLLVLNTGDSEDAIYWYTREAFVYHLLNRALRTEDISALYIFRFFIADLCRQLKIEHERQQKQSNTTPIWTVYRGGHISGEELDNLKETVGSLTSLNGFISTSLEKWVALEFIHRPPSKENVENFLFIIEIDIRSEHVICVNVENLSALKEEAEVLLNIGTVFYVTKIDFDSESQIWQIYMKTTEAGIEAAHEYMKLVHRELTDSSISIIFGQLFIQMGRYVVAQKYFHDLLSSDAAARNSAFEGLLRNALANSRKRNRFVWI